MRSRPIAIVLAITLPLACGDPTGTEIIPPPDGSTVAALEIEPDSISLKPGESRVLTATPVDSNGAEVAVDVVWVTRDPGTVTSRVRAWHQVTATGASAGTTWLVAAAGETRDSAKVVVEEPDSAPPPGTARGWHVSPAGSDAGAGTPASPWSLAYALTGAEAQVQPGDTVWLRGGVYEGGFTSRLEGSREAPILVRQWPGERAVIDGALLVLGRDVWLWGFEVTNSDPVSFDIQAVDLRAPRGKLINLVIHNASGDGIGAWAEAQDAELAGNILYSNGRVGSAIGRAAHGIYAQSQTGAKMIRDNIVFQTYGYGLHFYAEESFLRDFTVDGNVLFENGMLSGCNVLIGGAPPVERLTFTDNLLYQHFGDGCVWLGREGPVNGPGLVRGNVIGGGDPSLRLYGWGNGLTVDSNTVVRLDGVLVEQFGPSATSFSRNRWFGIPGSGEWVVGDDDYAFEEWRSATRQGATDSYAASPPTSNLVVVRPNPYERNRATVVVYNWTGAGSIQADLSDVLEPGRPYAVRHVYRLLGDPVAQGTYQGGTVDIPLVPIPAPVPLAGWPERESRTAPDFWVFIVQGE